MKIKIGQRIYLPAFDEVFEVDMLPFFPPTEGYHTTVYKNGVYEAVSTTSTSARGEISGDVVKIPKKGALLVRRVGGFVFQVSEVLVDAVVINSPITGDDTITFKELKQNLCE